MAGASTTHLRGDVSDQLVARQRLCAGVSQVWNEAAVQPRAQLEGALATRGGQRAAAGQKEVLPGSYQASLQQADTAGVCYVDTAGWESSVARLDIALNTACSQAGHDVVLTGGKEVQPRNVYTSTALTCTSSRLKCSRCCWRSETCARKEVSIDCSRMSSLHCSHSCVAAVQCCMRA